MRFRVRVGFIVLSSRCANTSRRARPWTNAIVFCLLGMLVVEMFGGIRGMGFLPVSLANAFQAPELFAAPVLVSLLSVGIVLGLERLNRRLGHWR